MKQMIISLLLIFLITGCVPATPELSDVLNAPASAQNQGADTQPESGTNKTDFGDTDQLETSMQSSVIVVRWNSQTRHNEIAPVETASAKTPPGAEPVVVSQEFLHAFSSDGKTLAIVSAKKQDYRNSELHLVNVPTWTQQESVLSFEQWVDRLVFSPDGNYLLIVHWPPPNGNKPAEHATFTLVDVPTQSVIAETNFPYRPEEISFSERGLVVLAVPIVPEIGDDYSVAQAFVLNLKDFSILWQTPLTNVYEGVVTSFEGEDSVHSFLSPGVAVSSDGRFLYVVHADENKLTTVDTQTEQVSTVAISPKLSWLDRLLTLTARTAYAKVSNGVVKDAILSPDGSLLYVVGRTDEAFKDENGEWQYNSSPSGLQIIDVSTGTEIAHEESDATEIIGISTDGTRLYLQLRGDTDQTYILNTATLNLMKWMSEYKTLPAETLDGSQFALSSRTTSNGQTTMTILNPDTFGMVVQWTEEMRAYFLPGQAGSVESRERNIIIKSSLETCLVTIPGDNVFVPPEPYPNTAPYPGQFWYGSDTLWTALPENGQWTQLAYGEKVFWWKAGYEASAESQPELSVSARRLDVEAPVVEFGPPASNAYHEDFQTAMLIGVELPNTGCWELTGHYGSNDLTFVVWVGE